MNGKLRYYLRRLTEAPPRVIVQKIFGAIKRSAYRAVYPKSGTRRTFSKTQSASVRRAMAAELGQSLTANLRKAGSQDAQFAVRALARAQNVLKHEVECLGYGRTKIPSNELWWADEFHGYTWPAVYFSRIDFVAEDVRCDVKVPWELSRLQYLVWLAEGAIFDARNVSTYRNRFLAIVSNWLEYNPTAYGVNWTCPMEVGIRAINLSLSYSIFASELDEASSTDILISLDDHATFIARFLEVSDIPGNHYLADLAGRVFPLALQAGLKFDNFSRSVELFADEATRQFEAGGCHLERAPIYHRLCLDLVALVLALSKRHGHRDTVRLAEIFDRGLAFCSALGTSAGKLPVFGDCDSGHVLDFGYDAREYLGLQQFARGLQSKPVQLRCDLAHWLFALADISPSAETESQTIELRSETTAGYGGFISARCGDLVAVMRVGEQGLLGRAPHDHDDALSIWLTKGDQDLIIEEGCHSYTLDPAVRTRYIASTAHNVIQPAHRTRYSGVQGSIFETVRGAPTASTWKHGVANGKPQLDASLETQARPGQLFESCRRKVVLDSPHQISVFDEWSWRDRGAANLRWHFGQGLKVEIDGMTAFVHNNLGRTVMTVKLDCEIGIELSVFEYCYSPLYGLSISCEGLVISVPAHKSCAVRSSFAVLEKEQSILHSCPPDSLELSQATTPSDL